MDSRNIPTDVSSYNMRISLLGRLKRVDEAFELLQEMSRNGIDPNEGTVTSLLTACRAGRDAERALRVFELLDRWGLPPGNPIHSSLLESIFSQNRRSDLEKKWRATLAEWNQSQSTTPKPEPLETAPCPPPYRKRRFLTPQQLKKAAKPVSASRKAFLRRQSGTNVKTAVEKKD